jgi:hypothetical protein
MKFKLFTVLAAIAILFAACKKDETPVPDDNTGNGNGNGNSGAGNIRLSFHNLVGTDTLELGGNYKWVNANGDSFLINTYKYYISNIKFTDSNGDTWSETESYHLINSSDPSSLSFLVSGMPAGTYTSVQFMIGVDSARNVSGVQSGALDPANNMFWTWSTGYIMAKLEGKSNMSTASANNITFHIAGYRAPTASQRIVSPSFNSASALTDSVRTPEIHINSDILEWFQTPNLIRFNTLNYVMSTGNNAMMIADNYSDMFTVSSIEN